MAATKKKRSYLPWILGAGTLGVLLFAGRSASAGGRTAPPGQRAMVLNAVRARTQPNPNAPEIDPGDERPIAPAGVTVEVLQTGIPSTSPLSREWWRVRILSGHGADKEGYVSAVGPDGEPNLRLI